MKGVNVMRCTTRIVSFVLAVIMCLSIMPQKVHASSFAKNECNNEERISEDRSSLITSEAAMPELTLDDIAFVLTRSGKPADFNNLQTNGFELEDTLHAPERAAWVSNTSDYLCAAFGQDISNVRETKDLIVFEFSNPEDSNLYEEHVLKVEYIKPESTLRSEYETKFVYMWGWKSGYYELGSRTGIWSAIKNLTIAVAGLSDNITLATFAASILDIAIGLLQGPEKIDARSTVKYYFLNKYVQVKSPQFGYWLPMAEAGIRKGCRRCILEKIDAYGQSTTLGFTETIGQPSSNPTNCEETKTSPHFYNDTWLINKAIQMFLDDDTYSEAFGIPDVIYQGPNMP